MSKTLSLILGFLLAFSLSQAWAQPPVKAGTAAPDGIGVAVGGTRSAGTMENGPWVDEPVTEPLAVGDRFPAESFVKTPDGASFDLNQAIAEKPSIVIVYRGGWCPYCSAHLAQLRKSVPQLMEMGYQVLAISSDTPEELAENYEVDNDGIRVLSDGNLEVARRLGLVFKVQQSYLDHLQNDHNQDMVGKNGGYLPTPAALVLDQQQTIRFAYVNPNYTVRISQEALIKAAADVLESSIQ